MTSSHLENQKKREEEIRKTYHPNLRRRVMRRIRNTCNLMRDAFGQAISVFIGQIKRTSGSSFIQSQDARLTTTAQQLISYGNSAYEPILEKYIGRKIIVELPEESGHTEYCGILKFYTEAFLSILDVETSEEYVFDLANLEQLAV